MSTLTPSPTTLGVQFGPITLPDLGRVMVLPYEVADIAVTEISRAHLSLHALSTLLSVDGISPDPISLARLLSYIQERLEDCSGALTSYTFQK